MSMRRVWAWAMTARAQAPAAPARVRMPALVLALALAPTSTLAPARAPTMVRASTRPWVGATDRRPLEHAWKLLGRCLEVAWKQSGWAATRHSCPLGSPCMNRSHVAHRNRVQDTRAWVEFRWAMALASVPPLT